MEDINIEELKLIIDKIINEDNLDKDYMKEKKIEIIQNFADTENKGKFLEFFENHLLEKENEAEDQKVLDRIENFKKELNICLEKLFKNLSVYRVYGLDDPEEIENNSDSESNEFSYKESGMINTKIKVENHLNIMKTLEKIKTLSIQKENSKVNILQKWRYNSLKNKFDKIKNYNKLFLILNKKMEISYEYEFFNELKTYRNDKILEDIGSMRKRYDSLFKKHNDLIENSNIVSNNIVEQINGHKNSKDLEESKISDKSNFEESELINEMKIKIKNLQVENNKLINENKEFKIYNDELKKDKQILNEKKLIANNNSIKNVENDYVNKVNDLKSKIKLLVNSKEEKNKNSLNYYGKVRFFKRNMFYFVKNLMQISFVKIYSFGIKNKKNILESTERIKGLALSNLRNSLCADDKKKLFYKWFLKTNKNVVRQFIQKIALTSQINNNSAIWRMKILIQKPIKISLNSNQKILNNLKAIFLTENLFKKIFFVNKGYAMKKFKYNVENNKSLLLKKLLDQCYYRNQLLQKSIIDKLRNYFVSKKKTCNRINRSFSLKLVLAFSKFKTINDVNASIKKNKQKEIKYKNIFGILENKIKNNICKALDISKIEKQKSFFICIKNNMISKKLNVINKLINVNKEENNISFLNKKTLINIINQYNFLKKKSFFKLINYNKNLKTVKICLDKNLEIGISKLVKMVDIYKYKMINRLFLKLKQNKEYYEHYQKKIKKINQIYLSYNQKKSLVFIRLKGLSLFYKTQQIDNKIFVSNLINAMNSKKKYCLEEIKKKLFTPVNKIKNMKIKNILNLMYIFQQGKTIAVVKKLKIKKLNLINEEMTDKFDRKHNWNKLIYNHGNKVALCLISLKSFNKKLVTFEIETNNQKEISFKLLLKSTSLKIKEVFNTLKALNVNINKEVKIKEIQMKNGLDIFLKIQKFKKEYCIRKYQESIRLDNLKIKMLNRLFINNNKKIKNCLKNILFNTKNDIRADKREKKLKNLFLNKIKLSYDSKLIFSLNRLLGKNLIEKNVTHAANNMEIKQTNFFNLLLISCKNKEKSIFFKLMKKNKIEILTDKMDKRRIFSSIFNNQNYKLKNTINKISKSLLFKKIEKNKRFAALMNILLKNQKLKLNTCFNKFLNKNTIINTDLKQIKNHKKEFFNKLFNALKNKEKTCFNQIINDNYYFKNSKFNHLNYLCQKLNEKKRSGFFKIILKYKINLKSTSLKVFNFKKLIDSVNNHVKELKIIFFNKLLLFSNEYKNETLKKENYLKEILFVLTNSQIQKMNKSMNTIKLNNFSDNLYISHNKIKCENIISKLCNSLNNKRKLFFSNLSSINKNKTFRMFLAINKVKDSFNLKLNTSLMKFIETKKEVDYKNIIYKNKINLIIKKLVKEQSNKTLYCYDYLMFIKSNKIKNSFDQISKKIVTSHNYKNQSILQKLFNMKKNIDMKNQKIIKKKNFTGKKLIDSQNSKVLISYMKIKIKFNNNKEKIILNKKKETLNRLIINSNIKSKFMFNKIILKNKTINLRKDIIFNNFIHSQNLKKLFTFNALYNNKNISFKDRLNEKFKTFKKINLFKDLEKNLKKKSLMVLIDLKKIINKKKNQKIFNLYIFNKLIDSQKNKLFITYFSLAQKKLNNNILELNKANKKNKLLNIIKSNYLCKLNLCMNKLLNRNMQKNNKDDRKKILKKKFLSNLIITYDKKKINCFNKLKNYNEHYKNINKKKVVVFRKIEKSYNTMLLKTLNIFLNKNDKNKIYNENLNIKLNKMLISHQNKKSLVLKKLIFKKNKKNTNIDKLVKVLDNCFKNNNLKSNYDGFREFKNNLIEKDRIMLKGSVNYQSNKIKILSIYLNKWRLINKKEKMVNYFVKLNRVNNINKKMYRIVLKKFFEKWKKNNKNIYNILNEKLTNMINKRRYQAYAAIKEIYNSYKYEQKRNEIENLVNLIEKKIYKNNEYFFNKLKDQYLNSNPWFKKIIGILTTKVSTNDQVSFWKIKYGKNLGIENLDTEKILKLKRFVKLFNKLKFKQISMTYYKIDSNGAGQTIYRPSNMYTSIYKKYA